MGLWPDQYNNKTYTSAFQTYSWSFFPAVLSTLVHTPEWALTNIVLAPDMTFKTNFRTGKEKVKAILWFWNGKPHCSVKISSLGKTVFFIKLLIEQNCPTQGSAAEPHLQAGLRYIGLMVKHSSTQERHEDTGLQLPCITREHALAGLVPVACRSLHQEAMLQEDSHFWRIKYALRDNICSPQDLPI